MEDHVIGWVGSAGTDGVLVVGLPGDSASYFRWAGTFVDGVISGSAYYGYTDYYYGHTYYYGYLYFFLLLWNEWSRG